MNTICKVCNRNDLGLFIEFEKYPKTISNLFNSSEKAKSNFIKITFLKCNFCHHVQIGDDMPQDFYEDYIMTVSHSKKMNDFQIEQAEFFVKKFNLINKKVLEVGCGDGNFLKILKERGVITFGNEPSKPFRKLALERNLIVDDFFVNEDYSHPQEPFDAVVSREVMEHVPEPIKFLHNIRRLIKPDGFVLIEIPNFEKALKEFRYYDMFPDHLSYFTRESLTAAMLISGFKNVEIFYGMDDEFIYATAQNNSIDNKGLSYAKSKIKSDFEHILNNYSNVVVWGAGGKGIAALGSLNDTTKIKYVVDSDPHKINRYLPSSGVIVKSPAELYSDSEVKLLVITSLAYTDEILSGLKQNNFKAEVMVLSKDGIVPVDNYK